MTETEIANGALALLGVDLIAALTEPVPRARVLKARFAIDRDACLRERPWRFATERRTLPEASPKPAFRFTHAYLLPADALAIQQIGDTAHELGRTWAKEGRHIVTHDGPPLPVVLTVAVTDTSLFDSGFADALAARLAWSCAYALTRSRTLMESMYAIYTERLELAGTPDAQEGTPDPIASSDLLLRVR